MGSIMSYNQLYLQNKRNYLSLRLIKTQTGGSMRDEITNGVYDNVIGSGGFGRIFGSSSVPYVVKLMYPKTCANAEKEFNIHKKCYDAFVNCPVKLSQVDIIEPVEYMTESIIFNNQEYECGYKMPFIRNISELNNKFEKVLYHIVLKPEYSHTLNKQIGIRSTEPIHDDNPSRGFYAVGNYINDNILNTLSDKIKGDITSASEISKRMGYLCAIVVFGAQYQPKDAEYVLSDKDDKLCVTMLDFGMFEPIEFVNRPDSKDDLLSDNAKKEKQLAALNKIITRICIDIFMIDLYFPYKEDSINFNPFIEEFTKVASGIISQITDNTLINNMTYVLNGIVNYNYDL